MPDVSAISPMAGNCAKDGRRYWRRDGKLGRAWVFARGCKQKREVRPASPPIGISALDITSPLKPRMSADDITLARSRNGFPDWPKAEL